MAGLAGERAFPSRGPRPYRGRMARPTGVRNKGYDEKRDALLARAVAVVCDGPQARPSLREIAARLGVSVPTLKHYFGGRDELVGEVIRRIGEQGGPYLAAFAAPSGPLAASLEGALRFLLEGFEAGRLDRAHVLGLAEGLHHADLGPAYVERLLEPTLQAMEARLAAHRARGELAGSDDRAMALMLLAPLVLLLLHQGALGGAGVRKADVGAFVAEQVAAFVRAHGTAAGR